MNNETAYWLALINEGGLPLSQLKPLVEQWYLGEGNSIVELFNLSVAELTNRFNLSEANAQTLLKAAQSHPRQLQQLAAWQAEGIEVLPLSHPHYPARLRYTMSTIQRPLLLWATGQTERLLEPTIAIIGNPETEAGEIDFLNELLPLLIEENIGIVSGYGKGIDRTALEMMLDMPGGNGIAILPMGLSAFAQLTNKLHEPVERGQAVLLSPFPPETAFKETLAQARLMLVDSLALALLVPQVNEHTQSRAQTALEKGLPVLAGLADSPANRELIAAGAFLMTDPGEVIEMVQQAIIDSAMQSQAEQSQPPEDASPKPVSTGPLLNDSDDYALGKEVAQPMPAEQALDILSTMGNVPNSLREKLLALEKGNRKKTEDKEQ